MVQTLLQLSLVPVSRRLHCHNCLYCLYPGTWSSTTVSTIFSTVKSLGTNRHYCQYSGTHTATCVCTTFIAVSRMSKTLSQLSGPSVTLDTHCNSCQYYYQYCQYHETCSPKMLCKIVSIVGHIVSFLSELLTVMSVSWVKHRNNWKYCQYP